MQDAIFDALRRGAHDEALTLARDSVAAHSDDPQAWRLLAMALHAGGDSDAALQAIDAAIALAPDDADLHFHRAGHLIDRQRIEDAQSALSDSVRLDPNQHGAYVMQAQLAIGRGDLDEADRLARLAARIAPAHPWTQMIEGTVALHRGDADRALALLSAAAKQAPNDAQIRYSLGFAHIRKGHLAFAEHAFRGILDTTPRADNLRGLIADLQLQQGRPDDAADTLAPLLAGDGATPALRRYAGELELAAGRLDRALPLLRDALAARPDDPRALAAIFQVWHRKGDRDDARRTLEAALATSPEIVDLWRARLAVEPAGSDAVFALITRWIAAVGEAALAPLEMLMAQQVLRGDQAQAEAAARRILERQPDHLPAHLRLIEGLLAHDPAAAAAALEARIAAAGDDASVREMLETWRALALDRAGQFDAAAAAWTTLHAPSAARGIPLPEPSRPTHPWPDIAAAAADAPAVAFLVGAPGSAVERIAALAAGVLPQFRGDRFGARAPPDVLQNIHTAARLAAGELEAAAVVADWRAQLPARGVADGRIIDWLLWWDSALLQVLRAHLPQARLLIALRDPRDMLLDWLAFGGPIRHALPSVPAAAAWLARHLDQVAELAESSLFPHALLRMDGIVDDEAGVAKMLGAALGVVLPPPPAGLFGAPRFAAGHWRRYADAWPDAFAALTPVARRLGYTDA